MNWGRPWPGATTGPSDPVAKLHCAARYKRDQHGNKNTTVFVIAATFGTLLVLLSHGPDFPGAYGNGREHLHTLQTVRVLLRHEKYTYVGQTSVACGNRIQTKYNNCTQIDVRTPQKQTLARSLLNRVLDDQSSVLYHIKYVSNVFQTLINPTQP